MKKISFLFIMLFVGLSFISCEKDEDEHDDHNHEECCTDTGECCHDNSTAARMGLVEDGYTEIEVNPIEKIDCYFEEWDKTVMTAVSGLFEYYDQNNTWVASIDFGDGSCDQWATKTWDTNIFPDNPTGTEEFSLFE